MHISPVCSTGSTYTWQCCSCSTGSTYTWQCCSWDLKRFCLQGSWCCRTCLIPGETTAASINEVLLDTVVYDCNTLLYCNSQCVASFYGLLIGPYKLNIPKNMTSGASMITDRQHSKRKPIVCNIMIVSIQQYIIKTHPR